MIRSLTFFFMMLFALQSLVTQSHADGLAMHGVPKLPSDFTYFPYADPNAPKGGKITFGVVGTFDGLNPFVVKGTRTTARGLFNDEQFGSLVYEGFMTRSRDEPFTLYSLLAEKVEMNDERTIITFYLNPRARFSDGVPVTQDDVLFTVDLLRSQGRPPFTNYLKSVDRIEKIGPYGIRFYLSPQSNRELPLILASIIPILPKHAVNTDTFRENGFTVIPGTGPYIVNEIKPGERVIYRRNPDYWGKDLPVNKGLYNFDTFQIEYYRNQNARFEAFKKGILDVFIEEPPNPNRWMQGYNFPAAREGKVIKESFKKGTPAAMTGFVFNTRQPIFSDVRVRRALSMVLDFEWINRNLFQNAYQRTNGFWDNSELSCVGRPASDKERALLAPFPDAVLPQVMDGSWHAPHTNGNGFNRENLEIAWQILQEAGFTRKNFKIYTPDGQPFRFEIMTLSGDEERIALVFQRSLARLGVEASVRTVDDTQYQTRLSNFDYDMIIRTLSASLSPGNEQFNRWASSSRNVEGSFNYAGAHSKAIDAMIEAMTNARSAEDFVAAVRALDRILISGNYFIPLYHLPNQWVARWNTIKHPDYTSLYGYRISAWWRDNKEGQ